MCTSEKRARSAYDLANRILGDELGLKLHALGAENSKTRITLYSKGFTFLGIHFQGGQITPGSGSVGRFKTKISAITDYRQGQSLLRTLTSLKNTIEGWGHAYRMYDSSDIFRDLDQHIRERLAEFLRANRLLGKGHVLGASQLRFLGVPTLLGILPRSHVA